MELELGIYYDPDWLITHLNLVTWKYHPSIKTFFADFGAFSGGSHDIRKNAELVKWCEENYCVMARGWVECPDESTATMFKLKWT